MLLCAASSGCKVAACTTPARCVAILLTVASSSVPGHHSYSARYDLTEQPSRKVFDDRHVQTTVDKVGGLAKN